MRRLLSPQAGRGGSSNVRVNVLERFKASHSQQLLLEGFVGVRVSLVADEKDSRLRHCQRLSGAAMEGSWLIRCLTFGWTMYRLRFIDHSVGYLLQLS